MRVHGKKLLTVSMCGMAVSAVAALGFGSTASATTNYSIGYTGPGSVNIISAGGYGHGGSYSYDWDWKKHYSYDKHDDKKDRKYGHKHKDDHHQKYHNKFAAWKWGYKPVKHYDKKYSYDWDRYNRYDKKDCGYGYDHKYDHKDWGYGYGYDHKKKHGKDDKHYGWKKHDDDHKYKHYAKRDYDKKYGHDKKHDYGKDKYYSYKKPVKHYDKKYGYDHKDDDKKRYDKGKHYGHHGYKPVYKASNYFVENNNYVNVRNVNKQVAVSGDATVKRNTYGGHAKTGNAYNVSNISTAVNIRNESPKWNDNYGYNSHRTSPWSYNRYGSHDRKDYRVENNNYVTVNNDNSQYARTGDAYVGRNTYGGSAITGDAYNSSRINTAVSIRN